MSPIQQADVEVRIITRCAHCDTLLDAQGPCQAQKRVTIEGECWPQCAKIKQRSGATVWGIQHIALILTAGIRQFTSIFVKI